MRADDASRQSAAAPEPSSIVLVFGGAVTRRDVPTLCDDVCSLLRESDAELILCDVGAVVDAPQALDYGPGPCVEQRPGQADGLITGRDDGMAGLACAQRDQFAVELQVQAIERGQRAIGQAQLRKERRIWTGMAVRRHVDHFGATDVLAHISDGGLRGKQSGPSKEPGHGLAFG